MLSHLFINAIALGFGILIGYQRAKEIYIAYANKQINAHVIYMLNTNRLLKVVFTEQSLEELKKEYNKAKVSGKDTFVFKEATLYLDYAKYMIEYLDNEFKKVKNLHNSSSGV